MSNEYLLELRDSLDELSKQLLQLGETVKECTSQLPRQKKHRRVPPNAYTVFFKEQLTQMKETDPEFSQTSALQQIAALWKELNDEQRQEYQSKATEKSRTFYERVGENQPTIRKPRCLHCFRAHRVCHGGSPCMRCAAIGLECENRTRKPRASTKT